MSQLETLLRQAAASGASEVRLITGRKIILVTPAGEREVQGPEVGPPIIQQLVVPTMSPEARAAIAKGRAEWTIHDAEAGSIQAVAELAGGTPRIVFTLPQKNAAPVAATPAAAPAPSPVARVASDRPIDEMFRQMFALKASDLHISTGAAPLLRLDGEIKPLPGHTAVLSAADVETLLMPIAPEKNKKEFAQRHDTDFAYELAGVSRFRCNFFLDRKGMGGVFRVIPSKIMTAEEMGLSKEILDLCFLSKGLVLITGPTGSGKSTTLCALIDYVNRYRSDHIITIEDPIEFVHENKRCLINQRQVGEHTSSFKDALRAALREDPDIVLVGEMRDLETVAIAIETAETGHLVFGTLHTASAASTVDRIVDQFPADRQDQIRVMLASSLKGVISQVLCRKIGGGRVPALEVMIGTAPIANMIREAKIFQIPSIMQTSRKQGMMLMNDSFLDLVKKKVVEPQEAYAKAVDKVGLLTMFKGAGIDTSFATNAPS
ncbi:MAG TPA: type IV pilus twitching motility protein PilT [Thermoanaerobaculia bacterium]|nr:type IV pilus twitching motility protein PilT [Thermoanaerobaculia bacterium]